MIDLTYWQLKVAKVLTSQWKLFLIFLVKNWVSSANNFWHPNWWTDPTIFRRGRQVIESLLWEIFNAASYISGCIESSGNLLMETWKQKTVFRTFGWRIITLRFKSSTTMQNCIIDACFNHCWLMRTFRSYRAAENCAKYGVEIIRNCFM